MSATVVHSRVLLGFTAHAVTVECHVGSGLPSTTIVGLPEGAVREARDRIRAALTNSGFEYPDGRVVINLAPGHLAKSGSFLDLAMAISILAATAQLRTQGLARYELLGELSLFGELRQARGALTCALAANNAGRILLIPSANGDEAALAPAGTIGLVQTLAEAAAVVNGSQPPQQPSVTALADPQANAGPEPDLFAEISGQAGAKRALAIAACGGHHALMVGPPGTGKTMLARAFTNLLPCLSPAQALEVAAIYSAAGLTRTDHSRPPFRDPHHSASAPALMGGGRTPLPGEVSLAHHGVLFLDELPHFKPAALNLLREPIESGEAVISRTSYNVRFPCRFQLIAAMNPCPAGQHCREDACRCSPSQVRSYQSRVSGPMLDRVDIQVSVTPVPQRLLARLSQDAQSHPSRADIAAGRAVQMQRQGKLNAELTPAELQQQISTAQSCETLIRGMEKQTFSARSFHKIWRVARTVADLERVEAIQREHLAEAISYRALDWQTRVGFA